MELALGFRVFLFFLFFVLFLNNGEIWMCFVLVTNFFIYRVLAPLQHSVIFEIILNFENFQLQICYVYFNKIICIVVFGFGVVVFIFFIEFLFTHSLHLFMHLCMFGSSNAFATTFNDFDLLNFGNLDFSVLTFKKIDFARWVFNFLLCFCCKFFTLSCLFSLLFYQNNLQFVRLKFPCTYTWVIICKLVFFFALHCLS